MIFSENRYSVSGSCVRRLIFQQHARNFAAFEVFAGALRQIFLKPGKARRVERFVAFLHPFSERVSLAELVLGLALRLSRALLGFLLVGEGADLDDAAAA